MFANDRSIIQVSLVLYALLYQQLETVFNIPVNLEN
jgi:hypothetical protein